MRDGNRWIGPHPQGGGGEKSAEKRWLVCAKSIHNIASIFAEVFKLDLISNIHCWER